MRTAGPNSPRGYPIPSGGVLSHKSSGQDEEGTIRVKVFVFLSSH